MIFLQEMTPIIVLCLICMYLVLPDFKIKYPELYALVSYTASKMISPFKVYYREFIIRHVNLLKDSVAASTLQISSLLLTENLQ
jgi:hypothetical protein